MTKVQTLFGVTESPILEAEIGSIIDVEANFERTIFANETFTIASFSDDAYEEFTVLGDIPFELKQGRKYRVSGIVEEQFNKFHNEMVRQLKMTGIALLPPKGEVGIIMYLQSLKGLKTRSYKLYEQFKDETLSVMKKDPERVAREIKGISVAQAYTFQKQLIENEDTSETITFLLNIGLTLKEANVLFDIHSDKIQNKIEENPYLLTLKIDGFPGFGFPKADKIASRLDVDIKLPARIKAGVLHTLEREQMSGHCYSNWDAVVSETMRLLSNRTTYFTAEEIEDILDDMIIEDNILIEGENLYISSFYQKEVELGNDIKRLSQKKSWGHVFDAEVEVEKFLNRKGIILETQQREAVVSFLENKGDLCVLNGGAGTGKTFTANIILQMLNEAFMREGALQRARIMVLAPTGKAAKVLNKSLGGKYETMTIHRALKPEGFTFLQNRGNPFEENIFLIDETSMLDTNIAFALMQAIPNGSKVIMLGDTRQLPAIGAGNVLSDIMKSELATHVTLSVPKRQGAGSSIYENSKRILDKELVVPDNKETFWLKTSNGDQARTQTIASVKRLRSAYSFGIEDIQVLSPMRKGPCGTNLLNHVLQDEFNPTPDDVQVLNKTFNVGSAEYKLHFRTGDKVIQTVNNMELIWAKKDSSGQYVEDLEIHGIVTNGEQGIVVDIYEDLKEQKNGRKQKVIVIAVQYDQGVVLYHGDEKRDLDHAYAITVHKSQGSQWPVVIQTMDAYQRMMLDNEMFYTGYSRAEKMHVLIADERSTTSAINTRRSIHRKTTLVKRIQGGRE